MGIIFSILAGVAMSLQGVFNTRLSDKIGLWEANTFVQGSALAITMTITLLFGKGSFNNILNLKKLYLLGGVLSVIIIYTVVFSIKNLGTTYAIGIILIAQICSAALIDYLGLFETDKVTFGISKIVGVILMIVGVIVFKWRY
ncbi:MAG: DMT family transporter [Clostridiaceae bacterium]